MYLSNWFSLKEIKPKNGQDVIVKTENNAVTAVYYEGDFYKLELDNVIGCLKKVAVKEPVIAWCVLKNLT